MSDYSTGLMWQQSEPGRMQWGYANTYCENLNLAGYDDWHLPSVNQLQSLINTNFYPQIDMNFFPYIVIPSDFKYWTSEFCQTNPYWAYLAVSFADSHLSCYKTSSDPYVRAVRHIQCGTEDSDCDSILNDGDNSGITGDNPCRVGQKENCDDSCTREFSGRRIF